MNVIRTDCFLHGDVENLMYFRDRNGIPFILGVGPKPVAYAMAGADIVKIFYTIDEAEKFMNILNNYELPASHYFFDEKLMIK